MLSDRRPESQEALRRVQLEFNEWILLIWLPVLATCRFLTYQQPTSYKSWVYNSQQSLVVYDLISPAGFESELLMGMIEVVALFQIATYVACSSRSSFWRLGFAAAVVAVELGAWRTGNASFELVFQIAFFVVAIPLLFITRGLLSNCRLRRWKDQSWNQWYAAANRIRLPHLLVFLVFICLLSASLPPAVLFLQEQNQNWGIHRLMEQLPIFGLIGAVITLVLSIPILAGAWIRSITAALIARTTVHLLISTGVAVIYANARLFPPVFPSSAYLTIISLWGLLFISDLLQWKSGTLPFGYSSREAMAWIRREPKPSLLSLPVKTPFFWRGGLLLLFLPVSGWVSANLVDRQWDLETLRLDHSSMRWQDAAMVARLKQEFQKIELTPQQIRSSIVVGSDGITFVAVPVQVMENQELAHKLQHHADQLDVGLVVRHPGGATELVCKNQNLPAIFSNDLVSQVELQGIEIGTNEWGQILGLTTNRLTFDRCEITGPLPPKASLRETPLNELMFVDTHLPVSVWPAIRSYPLQFEFSNAHQVQRLLQEIPTVFWSDTRLMVRDTDEELESLVEFLPDELKVNWNRSAGELWIQGDPTQVGRMNLAQLESLWMITDKDGQCVGVDLAVVPADSLATSSVPVLLLERLPKSEKVTTNELLHNAKALAVREFGNVDESTLQGIQLEKLTIGRIVDFPRALQQVQSLDELDSVTVHFRLEQLDDVRQWLFDVEKAFPNAKLEACIHKFNDTLFYLRRINNTKVLTREIPFEHEIRLPDFYREWKTNGTTSNVRK